MATIGILSERAISRGEVLNEQLQAALNSRVIIEQAKGVLAERGNIDMDAAFDRLRRYSRDHNLKLSDVGRQIIEADLATAVLARQPARKVPRHDNRDPHRGAPAASMVTGLFFALCAMVLNSGAGLLQSDATRRTRRRHPLVVQPRYLGGLLVDGLGWACTAIALRHLPVFAVQAILGGTIAITALAARTLFGSALRPVDRVAIGACLLGLVLVAASAGTQPPPAVSVTAYVVLSAAAVGLAVVTVRLWHGDRAWPMAVVAGLGFGATSLAVRAVVDQAGDLTGLLTQPAPYLVVVFWVVGLASYTRALVLGTLSRVTAVFLVTEVLVPGLVGVVLLGDTVRAGWWFPLVVGLLLAVAGVVVLAHSPAQAPPRPRRVR